MFSAQVMPTIVMYDVSDLEVQVRNAMMDLGYRTQLTRNGKTHPLPTTTLLHRLKTPTEALTDLETVCADLQVRLQRYGAAEVLKWVGAQGDDV